MHVAIALLPSSRSRTNNNSHNNRNAVRLPRAAWSLCSTGARLMQTNAKFTTGKLSTARWLRDRERLNLNRNQNQNQNLKSETGMGNGNSHFGGCGNCSQRCTLLLLLLYAPLRKCKFDLRRLECVSCGASQCVYFGQQVFNCRKQVQIGCIK